jgi:hypothetical protein
MFKVHHSKPIFYGLIVAATFAVGVARSWAADGVLSKTSAMEGSYCHLKFPAIRSSTLVTNHRRAPAPGMSWITMELATTIHWARMRSRGRNTTVFPTGRLTTAGSRLIS